MKISLIHPSRGRAEKSFLNAKEWVLKAGKGIDIELILSIDSTDPDKLKYIELYTNSWIDVVITENDNKSVVEATNIAAEISKDYDDVLVYLSDDFKCHDNWGRNIEKELLSENGPKMLHVDDCLQKFSARVLTIPIMNRALYEKLGYFFHPDYKSMWVDCDLYETCDRIGVIKKAPHLKFPHEHHCIGKAANDETYRRSEANWNQGKKVFDRRKRQGFPI